MAVTLLPGGGPEPLGLSSELLPPHTVSHQPRLACSLTHWCGATTLTSWHPWGAQGCPTFLTPCLSSQLERQQHRRGRGQGLGPRTEGQPQPAPPRVSVLPLGTACPEGTARGQPGQQLSLGQTPELVSWPLPTFPPEGHISLPDTFCLLQPARELPGHGWSHLHRHRAEGQPQPHLCEVSDCCAACQGETLGTIREPSSPLPLPVPCCPCAPPGMTATVPTQLQTLQLLPG